MNNLLGCIWFVLCYHKHMDGLREQPKRVNRSSSLVLKTIELPDRRTSIKLEPEMWEALLDICAREGTRPSEWIARVEARRRASSLTSAVRVAIIEHYRALIAER